MTATAQRPDAEEVLGGPLRWMVWSCGTPARGDLGHRWSVSGRVQLRRSAAELLGADPGAPARDEHGRWLWPQLRLHGSVSTVPGLVSVALSTVGPVGVDIQDERDRPHALVWARRKLGRPDDDVSIGLGNFSEIESLLKAAGLVERRPDTVDLPVLTAGWRRTTDDWWVRSTRLDDVSAFASIVATSPHELTLERRSRGVSVAGLLSHRRSTDAAP